MAATSGSEEARCEVETKDEEAEVVEEWRAEPGGKAEVERLLLPLEWEVGAEVVEVIWRRSSRSIPPRESTEGEVAASTESCSRCTSASAALTRTEREFRRPANPEEETLRAETGEKALLPAGVGAGARAMGYDEDGVVMAVPTLEV
jgi:hypothetical protein